MAALLQLGIAATRRCRRRAGSCWCRRAVAKAGLSHGAQAPPGPRGWLGVASICRAQIERSGRVAAAGTLCRRRIRRGGKSFEFCSMSETLREGSRINQYLRRAEKRAKMLHLVSLRWLAETVNDHELILVAASNSPKDTVCQPHSKGQTIAMPPIALPHCAFRGGKELRRE